MKFQRAVVLTLGLGAGLVAVPGFAANINIFETPGEVTLQDLGFAIPPGTPGNVMNGTFFLGDIVLCEPNVTCPTSLAGTDIAGPSNETNNGSGVSDVLRFADLNGEAFAILYSDPYMQSQPSFPIYGPGDLSSFIAAGFGRNGDSIAMGNNSGNTIPEVGPPTVYSGINVWSDTNESEVPEPAAWPILLAGVAGGICWKVRARRRSPALLP